MAMYSNDSLKSRHKNMTRESPVSISHGKIDLFKMTYLSSGGTAS